MRPTKKNPSPRLKKRLGQHHLTSGRLCRPLVEFLRPAGERVVEIGPGGGVLTAELLEAGARVLAWELDLEWAFELRRRLGEAHPPEALHVAVVDALDIDLERLPSPTLFAGNLPFNVASPILEGLLPHAATIPRAAFMVQKEVAERLVAKPGDAAYGGLSVLVAAWASVRYLATVKPGSFRPPPKVSAAFVGLELHPPPLPVEEMPAFTHLVRLAFSKRRKTLRNALTSGLDRDHADALIAAAGVDPRIRAERLGLEEFVAMFRASKELASP